MKKVAICKFEDLIGKEDAISVNTMLSIEKIKNKKYLLLVHSNKNLEELLYYNRDFPFIDYIVSEKGYYFYDVKKGKKVINNKFSKQIINKICKMFKNRTIKFIGENGIIKENRIRDEDIYEINIFDSVIKNEDFNLNISKEKDRVNITIKELSYENIMKDIYSKLKLKEENIIEINKEMLN